MKALILSTGVSSTLLLVAISAFFLVLPFFFVSFPPSTDLPQHLSQVRLLSDALSGKNPSLVVNWYGPNNLIYLLLAGTVALFPVPLCGKVALVILVLLWIGAIHFLAIARNRPPETALLAVLVTYNFSLYWGLLNYMIGWPFFVLWLTVSAKQPTKRRWLYKAILAAFLYGSHALWFLLACLWLVAHSIANSKSYKAFIYRVSPVLPFAALSIPWYFAMSSAREAARWDISAVWDYTPLARLTPSHLTDSLFGGLTGVWEPIIAAAILGWILLALYSNRAHLRRRSDGLLLLTAAALTGVMLFGPDSYVSTILFAKRWFPIAGILLIIGLPAPAISRKLQRAVIVLLLITLSFGSASAWYKFERQELSGLEQSLAEIPENKRVLGLSFVKDSAFIKGRPFLQMFAYAQAQKGGELNFSFAEFTTGIVRYRSWTVPPWTVGLEWFPELVQEHDLKFFDFALVNGDARVHLRFGDVGLLEPVTSEGRWRLYRVINPVPPE